MYAYYILYVYGQSLVLNAIPCVSMCDSKDIPYTYIYAYYILYVYGQSLVLNAICHVFPYVTIKIYLIHTYRNTYILYKHLI